MVLPPSSADPQDGPHPSWVKRVARIRHLGRYKVLSLVVGTGPVKLRTLALALLDSDEPLALCTRAVELASLKLGSLVLFVPGAEDTGWLNQNRPLFAERKLRVFIWADTDMVVALKHHAPDFFDWISHTVECPGKAAEDVPGCAIAGLRSASTAATYPGVVWRGNDLATALDAAFPGAERLWISARQSYDALVGSIAQASDRWLVWTDVREPRDLTRVRWALAESDRRQRCVLYRPDCPAPGWWPASDEWCAVHDAVVALEPSCNRAAGMAAVLLGLEPDAITLLRDADIDDASPLLDHLRHTEDPGATLARHLFERGRISPDQVLRTTLAPVLRELSQAPAVAALRREIIARTQERLDTWNRTTSTADKIPALADVVEWAGSCPSWSSLPDQWPSRSIMDYWLEAALRAEPQPLPRAIAAVLAAEHRDVAERWHRVRGLEIPSHAARRSRGVPPRSVTLWNVPTPPMPYVAHPSQAALVRALVDHSGPTATRHGIVGVPGIGKTALAAVVARMPEVLQRFNDGIFWMYVGSSPNIVTLQAELARAMGLADTFVDQRSGKALLLEALAHRRLLLVLDDVCNPGHLTALDIVGQRGGLLVTTCDKSIFAGTEMTEWPVHPMNRERALELIAALVDTPVDVLPSEATELAQAAGFVPRALALVGALIQSGRVSWRNALKTMQRRQLDEVGLDPAAYYPPKARANREAQLARLLAEMFSPEELYRFLHHHVDRSLTDDLPSYARASRNEYATQAAEKILDRALLTRAFLDAWIAERPRRAAEIRALV